MKTGPRITLEKKCEDLYFLKTDTTSSYQIYKKIIKPWILNKQIMHMFPTEGIYKFA